MEKINGVHAEELASNVVDMKNFQSSMTHPVLAQVEAYWEDLRGNRPAPLRSEVDPRGIEMALENAFILERIAPSVARFRLAGMQLNDLMGMEVRGMPVTSFFVPDVRSRISEAMEHVFEEPAKARFRLQAETGIGRNAISAEMLLLPLKSDLGDISRALGCFVYEGNVGRTPRRFDLLSADLRPLTGAESTYAAPGAAAKREVPAATARPQQPREFAESQSPYRAPRNISVQASEMTNPDVSENSSERPYLRLVRNSD